MAPWSPVATFGGNICSWFHFLHQSFQIRAHLNEMVEGALLLLLFGFVKQKFRQHFPQFFSNFHFTFFFISLHFFAAFVVLKLNLPLILKKTRKVSMKFLPQNFRKTFFPHIFVLIMEIAFSYLCFVHECGYIFEPVPVTAYYFVFEYLKMPQFLGAVFLFLFHFLSWLPRLHLRET